MGGRGYSVEGGAIVWRAGLLLLVSYQAEI